MSAEDTIGVVRAHRWASVAVQRERLQQDGCRIIVELDGKKDSVTRSELEQLTRPGTVIKFMFPFLLADPKAKHKKGGMKADFLIAFERLTDKRKGIVKDVTAGITTADPMQKRAIIALAKEHLAASGKGRKSAENGKRQRGRSRLEFSTDEMRDAKAAWRNIKDFPTWEDVKAALPTNFTVHRAHRLWGPRK